MAICSIPFVIMILTYQREHNLLEKRQQAINQAQITLVSKNMVPPNIDNCLFREENDFFVCSTKNTSNEKVVFIVKNNQVEVCRP